MARWDKVALRHSNGSQCGRAISRGRANARDRQNVGHCIPHRRRQVCPRLRANRRRQVCPRLRATGVDAPRGKPQTGEHAAQGQWAHLDYLRRRFMKNLNKSGQFPVPIEVPTALGVVSKEKNVQKSTYPQF